MFQAASRSLKEEVHFDRTGVTSLDWNSYPILRFGESPRVTAIAISRPGASIDRSRRGSARSHGVAAIANAFYDATGVRLYQRPITPERVLAALRTA